MLFNLFKKEQKVELHENSFPKEEFHWEHPWDLLEGNSSGKIGLQKELNAEISSKHPLFGFSPIVFARSNASDDVLVFLNDGRFACVHLVWHGKVDQFPDKFPSTYFLGSAECVQKFLDEEAEEYT
ncbi:hypothetical protein L1D59_03135 [Pseudoalteromonas piscicida]|uniref:hypothetical protein n=1 Tax=Pseudoalteromonas piscicida TaxID=43662 RepID=UPI001EFC4599|nr:hypothetical protein [Pseudoalteromonas piscicida]MCG9767593.1 hypothetical protein [Pseudoalteromonas piscicida]